MLSEMFQVNGWPPGSTANRSRANQAGELACVVIGPSAIAPSEPVPDPVVNLGQLGLLIRREDLIEGRLSRGAVREQLARQASNRGRRLVDGPYVVGFHGIPKTLMGGLHVRPHGSSSRRGIREDRGRLLLLIGGQCQLLGQKADPPRDSILRTRRGPRGLRQQGCRSE